MANCTPISAINVAVHPDLQLNRVCTPRSAAARLIYHSVEVENVKDFYTEYDTLDFSLNYENRSMLLNSVRIEGDLRVLDSANNLSATDDIRLDKMNGAHNFFESFTIDTQNQGLIDSVQDYPRIVSMRRNAQYCNSDMLNSEFVCEMATGSEALSRDLLKGIVNKVSADAPLVNNDNDFSIKPHFCLNNASGNTMLSYAKTGSIRISTHLNRNANALFGTGMTGNITYRLKNVRVVFTSVPDSGDMSPTILRSVASLKQAVGSSFMNISSKVPAVVDAVSCSFITQANESELMYNNNAQERPPSITDLQFIFQDSTNSYVTYQIRDDAEIIDRYLESFGKTGYNNASLVNLKANSAYGIGLSFGEFIDLSNKKFNVQLQSGISSLNPYVIYLFFHTIKEL